MAKDTMPPCFCDEESATSCDWSVGVDIHYQRPGHPEAEKSRVQWELEQVPQLLAQIILQAMVAAANEKGLEVYAAWQRGCFEGDSPDEMVARARDMI